MVTDHNRPDAETGKFFLRDSGLVHGTRTGQVRRDEDRGLKAGRRYSDHSRVRREFIDRVLDMKIKGVSALSISKILNDEGLRTAGNLPWTEKSIVQLIETEKSRAKRDAWRPKHKTVDHSEDG